MTDDLPADPDQWALETKAAIDSVKAEVRGLPLAVAESRLAAALKARGVFLPLDVVRALARQMADPGWPLRHPVQAVRELRSRRALAVEETQLERESDELGLRLQDVQEVRTISSRRTVDGMAYTVTISPWSEQLATRVRAVAAPVEVVVKPAT